ncbi:hypothetical protein EF918_30940, partial [Streptomyces sp. WAC06614]
MGTRRGPRARRHLPPRAPPQAPLRGHRRGAGPGLVRQGRRRLHPSLPGGVPACSGARPPRARGRVRVRPGRRGRPRGGSRVLTTLRVHDYRSDVLPLLTEGVLPLVGELATAAAPEVSFPTRHWDGGPHLALHLGHEPLPAEVLAHARERLSTAAGHGTTWTPEEYARRAAALARTEGTPVRHELPHAHGSVLISTDSGAPDPLTAVRHRFLTALARELAALLPADPAAARTRAPGTALRWMAGLAAAYPGGLRFGSLSFHSHAEAFLASRPDGEELRARFAAAAQRYAPQTGRLVDTALQHPAELPGHAACTTALAALRAPELRGDVERLLRGEGGGAGGVSGQFGGVL